MCEIEQCVGHSNVWDTEMCGLEQCVGNSNMWSTAHSPKTAKDLMLTLDLDETIEQLAITNSMPRYVHV